VGGHTSSTQAKESAMNLVTSLTPEKASMRMTGDAIRFCIKKKELCDNPELNERLYLNNKGFAEIRNLEKYTGVRVLFLESNKLEMIDGLETLKHLQSLHLQENRIGE
jgi:dynein assembly factor 1